MKRPNLLGHPVLYLINKHEKYICMKLGWSRTPSSGSFLKIESKQIHEFFNKLLWHTIVYTYTEAKANQQRGNCSILIHIWNWRFRNLKLGWYKFWIECKQKSWVLKLVNVPSSAGNPWSHWLIGPKIKSYYPTLPFWWNWNQEKGYVI